jgi:hypothetical protein
MMRDGDSARKQAAECMKLAVKASCEERSDILRAMARSWTTLANQMDRLESNKVLQRYKAQPTPESSIGINGSSLRRRRRCAVPPR